jgi:DNA-binding response OmpR family regulator
MTATGVVLIVDDEPDIREGVGRWLSACGYETKFAQDGEEGVLAAQACTPDAIVLDVLMPKKDGFQTLAELGVDPRTSSIPVVMLSASLREEHRALDAGAKFFLHKPYDGKKLIAAVKAAIGPT